MANLRFIFSVLGWAMTIGAAGGLVDLTIDMAHHAWRADHVGLISIRCLCESTEVVFMSRGRNLRYHLLTNDRNIRASG